MGNEELDSDHRMFFELLHDCCLHSAVDGRDRIDPEIFHKIRQYMTRHFSYEEQVMRDRGYPGYLDHEKLHRYFEEKVLEFERIIPNSPQNQEQMASFLRDWFVKHIKEEDRKYAPYVHDR